MKCLKYTHIYLFSLAASSLTVNAGSIAISTFLAPGDISGNTLNLTTLGTSDWAIYGGTSTAPAGIVPFRQMDGGSGLGPLTWSTPNETTVQRDASNGNAPLYSWTNGETPNASATDFASSQTRFNFEADGGNQFSITAAASDQASTIYLSATSFRAHLTLTATLSDGSASPESIAYSAISTPSRSFVYKIDFTADSIAQTLTLKLEQTGSAGASGIFGVSAITLATIPEPGTYALLAGCFAFTAVALRRRTK